MKNKTKEKVVILKGSWTFICSHSNYGAKLDATLVEITKRELDKKMKKKPAVAYVVEKALVR